MEKPRTDFGNRLIAYRKARGLNQNDVAKAVGVAQGTVSRWETDVIPEGKNLRDLAEFFSKSVEELLGLKPVSVDSRLLIVGAVGAGIFRETLDFDAADQYEVAIPAPRNPTRANSFGLEVRGPSMNLHYPEGTILVCVQINDMSRDLRDGDHVIVYRRYGHQLEATCKELRMSNGSPWLWPRSSDPQYQAPIQADSDHENAEIEIHAVVIGAYLDRS